MSWKKSKLSEAKTEECVPEKELYITKAVSKQGAAFLLGKYSQRIWPW